MIKYLTKRMLLVYLFIVSVSMGTHALSETKENTYIYPTVYQMNGEGIDMESATASASVDEYGTINHFAVRVNLRNNTDSDREVVNATLLIADKSEIERLSQLSVYRYTMEMLRRKYRDHWYVRFEYDNRSIWPVTIKAGENDSMLFIHDCDLDVENLDNVAFLFQIYTQPRLQ